MYYSSNQATLVAGADMPLVTRLLLYPGNTCNGGYSCNQATLITGATLAMGATLVKGAVESWHRRTAFRAAPRPSSAVNKKDILNVSQREGVSTVMCRSADSCKMYKNLLVFYTFQCYGKVLKICQSRDVYNEGGNGFESVATLITRLL